jgi:hypothetical protein
VLRARVKDSGSKCRAFSLLLPSHESAARRASSQRRGCARARAFVALAEVYDLDQSGNSQLANISTRSFVQTGDDVAIGGFILGGADNGADVIIQAIEPSLSELGVSNALADPTLELRDETGC